MPTTEATTLKKMVAGMITTAAVFGGSQTVYASQYVNQSFLSSAPQTTSHLRQKSDNIMDFIQLDISNAGLSIVSSHSEMVNDNYFGDMKLINYFVELHGKTIEDMVSINMQIIDKHTLFDKEKIVLTFYAV